MIFFGLVKINIFWDVILCSWGPVYQTNWCHILEDSNLHSHCHENLKCF
jgi:hypothetical protein